jgi:hypothetical protein
MTSKAARIKSTAAAVVTNTTKKTDSGIKNL